jgi:hypothetical protein
LHAAHGDAALATLIERDRLLEARRSGVDPNSGRRPPSEAGRERSRRRLADAPERQQHAFDMLMMTYADAFGVDAADAFAKALNARHAGVDVVADASARSQGDAPSTSVDATREEISLPTGAKRAWRTPTALPVPKPLRSSVRSGVFGYDERGPVHPLPEEVCAITQERRAARGTVGGRDRRTIYPRH